MKTIIETLAEDDRFDLLVAAVKAAFLVGTLMGPGPFTLFAPTNEAFALLPPDSFRPLYEDRGQLAMAVAHHIVPARIDAADMLSGKFAPTLYNDCLRITARDSEITVDGARIVQSDIECVNGLVHAVDAVLLPSLPMAA